MDCTYCNAKIIEPYGYGENGITIIGDTANKYDVAAGLPLSGQPLDILRSELNFVGIHLDSCYLTNLWKHTKPSGAYNTAHFDEHLTETIREIQRSQYVLLIGTEITKILLPITNTTGILGLPMKSSLANPMKLMMVAPHPTTVMYGTLGEFRLTLEKLGRKIYG